VDADAEHAPSYAGLADTWALLAVRQGGAELALRAKTAARKALELDPDLAEAHTSLGFVTYFHEWDWDAAERCFQRALELAPNLANAHHWYWSLLACTGRWPEASTEIQRALELDPLAPIIVNNYGVHHYFRGDDSRALRYFRKALDLEPGFCPANFCLWRLFERQGRFDEATNELARGLRVLGRHEVATVVESAFASQGYGPAMERGAEELAAGGPSPAPEAVAWMYLAAGRKDKAMSHLEAAFAKRAPVMVWLNAAPEWAPLRDHPRFRELVSLVGLPAG
jgi:Tfp pilus assembly protein PilF